MSTQRKGCYWMLTVALLTEYKPWEQPGYTHQLRELQEQDTESSLLAQISLTL